MRWTFVAIGALSLAITTIAPAAAQPSGQASLSGVTAKPAPTIDTYDEWTGAWVEHFGRGNASPTYGQVITVPDDETVLVRFRFYMRHSVGIGHLILRGEVYQWDGDKATGAALWEGARRRIALEPGDGYRRVGFRVGGIELTSGAQYVLFASLSKDYEASTPDYLLRWAASPGESYQLGSFVFLNDYGHEAQWTTKPWDVIEHRRGHEGVAASTLTLDRPATGSGYDGNQGRSTRARG